MKKKRFNLRTKVKWMLVFLAALWIGVGVQAFLNAILEKESLVEAFSRLNTKQMESNLTVLAEIPQGFADHAERIRVMGTYAGGLGLQIDGPIEKRESTDRIELSYTKVGKFAQTALKCIVLSGDEENTEYLLLRLKIYKDTDDILHYRELAEDLCKQAGYEIVQTRVALFGQYEGNLSVEERNRESEALLKMLSGNPVYASRKLEDYTIYAYTPQIGEYVISAGKKINLQIIMEYDPETDQTNITVASPVLG